MLDKQLMVAGMNLGFYELLYLDWIEIGIRALKVYIEGEYVKWKLFSSTELGKNNLHYLK